MQIRSYKKMKGVWKWILLFVGVLIVAFLVALPFFFRGFGFGRGMMGDFGGYPMGGRGFGFLPFGFGIFALLVRLILPLLVLVLAIVGVISLVRGRPKAAAATPAGEISQPGAAAPAVETTPCAHCGKPLETGWVACPYCGEKV
jgi:hypothetical protein